MAKAEDKPVYGRVLIAGGTDWPVLGRKLTKKEANLDREDLLEPHILRSVANVAFTDIFTSHSSCHAVFLDVDQQAWMVGRNEHGQLGTDYDTQLIEPAPLSDPIFDLPSDLKGAKIINAACGRSHTLLVTAAGQCFASGANVFGACGHDSGGKEVWSFKLVQGLAKEKVVKASAGVQFSVVLCESGKVYSFGCPEKGQLGHGKNGEYIRANRVNFEAETAPILLKGALEGKKIVDISCGQQHTLALDKDGYVYSFGHGGLGRLGHGVQKDCMVPTIVDQFTHPKRIMRATKIACGASCSMILDGQRMLYLCGKFKNSGDGSSGQPWMNPKTVQDIQSYQMKVITSGGVTLWAIAEDGDNCVPIAWGQNAANGELALGVGEVKSATKPTRVEPLVGLDIIDVAAGQNTTFFLVRPPASGSEAKTDSPAPVSAPVSTGWDAGWGLDEPVAAPSPPVASTSAVASPAATSKTRASSTSQEKWEELQRFPAILDTSDVCVVCNKDEEQDDNPVLECEKCEDAYHQKCVSLSAVPETDWFCAKCSKREPLQKTAGKKNKRKADSEEEEDEKPKKGAKKATRGRKKTKS